jgi:beta-lactamase superfamily II metal-dependent hydrolase
VEIRYVSQATTPLYAAASGSRQLMELLWGDRVIVIEEGGDRHKVRARAKAGYVAAAHLGTQSLLEVYFIDVGQGDGVLIRTPDGRHVVIDGGYDRKKQPSGKNAADFVDWKFAREYGQRTITIDAMIASHNDADHYGGLADLLDAGSTAELDATQVVVEAFYHAGVAWWVNPENGDRWLGPSSDDGKLLTQLMGDRDAVAAAVEDAAEPRLQGEWREFMERVLATRTSDDDPTPIRRLSDADLHVPGFDGADGGVAIRVLGPVQKQVGTRPALRRYTAAHSKNTNGNSILLRLDYGRARILLTGDLNADSQRALLGDYAGRRLDFQCDVAKACHHGSDDVSYEFLSAMRPAVTIISSGDNEGHDHPRPGIVAASATTGYLEVTRDSIVSPLVYSTEIARSVNLGKVRKVTVPAAGGTPVSVTGDELRHVAIEAAVTKAGDLRPTTVKRSLRSTYVVAGLIYGLVNVRTDGTTILCATLNEKDNSWHTRVIRSRF